MPLIGKSDNRSVQGMDRKIGKRVSEGAKMLERAYTALPKVSDEQTSKIRSAKEKAKLCESKADSISRLKTASEELLKISGRLSDAEKMSDSDFRQEIKNFVRSYNETISAIDSSDRFVSSRQAGLETVTASYSKALGKAGITAGESGLTVNEDIMRRNSESAKKLFGNRFFYGSRIAEKASLLLDMARKAENKTGIYDRHGAAV